MAKFSIGEEVGVRGQKEDATHYGRPSSNGIIRAAGHYLEGWLKEWTFYPEEIHYRVEVIGYRAEGNADGCWEIPECFLVKLIRDKAEDSTPESIKTILKEPSNV